MLNLRLEFSDTHFTQLSDDKDKQHKNVELCRRLRQLFLLHLLPLSASSTFVAFTKNLICVWLKRSGKKTFFSTTKLFSQIIINKRRRKWLFANVTVFIKRAKASKARLNARNHQKFPSSLIRRQKPENLMSI